MLVSLPGFSFSADATTIIADILNFDFQKADVKHLEIRKGDAFMAETMKFEVRGWEAVSSDDKLLFESFEEEMESFDARFEGYFNFLMNASLLGFSLYEFYTKYYFTGYVAGLTLFNKTYHGGMHRASYLAREKNIESVTRFNMETLDLLSKISEGPDNHNMPAVIK